MKSYNPILIFAALLIHFLSPYTATLRAYRSPKRSLIPAVQAIPLPDPEPRNWGLPSINTTLTTPTNNTSLAFTPWPATPYQLIVPPGDYALSVILARSYVSYPPINLDELRDFLETFQNNLAAEYPPPGLSPRFASQDYYDLHSYTKWTIVYEEGFLAPRIPMLAVLDALDLWDVQLRQHGPASLNAYVLKLRTPRLRYADLDLEIESLTGGVGNVSSPYSGIGSFRTS